MGTSAALTVVFAQLGGIIMDKDRVEGKAKDIAGRVERLAGEWTGDKEAQVKGAAKQAEGKIQNATGKLKDHIRNQQNHSDEPGEDTENVA
jgi:uncharacterized protein YjbJ (UPF0337 family)